MTTSTPSTDSEIKISDTLSIDLDKNAFKVKGPNGFTFMQMSVGSVESDTGKELKRTTVDLKGLERAKLEDLASRVDTLFIEIFKAAGSEKVDRVSVDGSGVKIKNTSTDNWKPLSSKTEKLDSTAKAITDYIKIEFPQLLPVEDKEHEVDTELRPLPPVEKRKKHLHEEDEVAEKLKRKEKPSTPSLDEERERERERVLSEGSETPPPPTFDY
jgi:hypothetical protein